MRLKSFIFANFFLSFSSRSSFITISSKIFTMFVPSIFLAYREYLDLRNSSFWGSSLYFLSVGLLFERWDFWFSGESPCFYFTKSSIIYLLNYSYLFPPLLVPLPYWWPYPSYFTSSYSPSLLFSALFWVLFCFCEEIALCFVWDLDLLLPALLNTIFSNGFSHFICLFTFSK